MTSDHHPRPFYQGPVRTTWRLFGSRQSVFVASIALRFCAALCAAVQIVTTVWVAQQLRDDGLSDQEAVRSVVIIVSGFVAQYLSMLASNRFAWIATFEVIGEIRIRILTHLQRVPLGVLNSRRTGDISAVVTSDLEMVSAYAHSSLPVLIGAVGLPLAVFVALLFVDVPLALATAVSVIGSLPTFAWANARFKDLALERGDQLAVANSRIVEYIKGMAVAKTYGVTGEKNELFRHAVAENRRVNDLLAVRLTPLALLSMGLVQLGVPIVIAAVTYRWAGGQIDAATALVFFVLVLRVYGPIVVVASQVEGLRLADAALERIGRVMDLEPQAGPPSPGEGPTDATVGFADVSFSYEAGSPVLEHVSFEAKPGTTTAIVGPSGAGKSTILNLVARFWDPDEGTVSIGGCNVTDLDAEQLYATVTVVFQDVYLFQGTLRDNIVCGSGKFDTDMIEAAKAANIHDFIVSLPNGYDTMIGEGGLTVSGGERQRLSIARAILKDSPVILMDEATASMDSINEREVQRALASLVAGRTLIVVAHRLSTIRSADQILVLDRSSDDEPARLTQQGTHDELIGDEAGRYAAFWADRERASQWRAVG